MVFWSRSKSQQRQPQTATGRGRGAGRGQGAGRGVPPNPSIVLPAAKAKSAAAPAAAAPQRPAASDDTIKRQIQEVRDDKLKPLGEMLSHPPNEDMSSLIDMYLGEAHASLEQLQEHIAHSTDDEAMMGLVQLSSEFHDLQEQAENWKQRAAHGGSSPAAPPSHSGTPHTALPAAALGDSHASQGSHAAPDSRAGPQSHTAIASHASAGMSHIREGDGVVVLAEFDAMGETPVRLMPGQKGTVDEIDVDGDACIDFVGIDDMQWVSGEDFKHMRVLPPGETPNSSRRTPHGRTPQSSHRQDAWHPSQDPSPFGHPPAQPHVHPAAQEVPQPGQSQEDEDLQRALEASRQQHEQETGWASAVVPPPPTDTFEHEVGQSHAAAAQHPGPGAEQDQRREEAESTLRATLAGAGRQDKEMLTFAMKEAEDAGVSGALLEEGHQALRDLQHNEQLESARQQLQGELDKPERDAHALQHAITQASAAGLSDAELAPARDALKGIGEQQAKIKALNAASHGRDPNLLRTAIEEARHVGVSESVIKNAEKHLRALQFMTRFPEVDRASMLHGWHELASAIKKARGKLHEVLHSGAKADDVEAAVHPLEEAGGDDTECADARRIADARRAAHDQVVCALVTQDPQDLHSAQVALDHAGGPEADREHLKPALATVDSDNLLFRDLDLVLPGAVKTYLAERGRHSEAAAAKPKQADSAVAAPNAAFVTHPAPDLAPPKPAPASLAMHKEAGSKESSQPPVGQTFPLGQVSQPPAGQALQAAPRQISQPAARQATSAKESPREPAPAPTTRPNKPQQGQDKNSLRVAAEARQKEMKSKVERARQWVTSQDRVHQLKQRKQEKPQARTPQSTPTLLGQSLPHPAAAQAGLQTSVAGLQRSTQDTFNAQYDHYSKQAQSMWNSGSVLAQDKAGQIGHQAQGYWNAGSVLAEDKAKQVFGQAQQQAQGFWNAGSAYAQNSANEAFHSFGASFNGGQTNASSRRPYEDHSFWR